MVNCIDAILLHTATWTSAKNLELALQKINFPKLNYIFEIASKLN